MAYSPVYESSDLGTIIIDVFAKFLAGISDISFEWATIAVLMIVVVLAFLNLDRVMGLLDKMFEMAGFDFPKREEIIFDKKP